VIDRSVVGLGGKVAVVTGAAQGIGAAAAGALAAFGADVAICDRNVDGMHETAADVESFGRRCETGELDVRDRPARSTSSSTTPAAASTRRSSR
jgi:2,3-dihydro-2,3-dihydroxybenzoate dehydrogenase